MCTSEITKKKFFKLLGERYFYAVTIWCLFFFTGYEAFSVKGFMKMVFPFFTVADNFTGCFLLFYLLIPFLNKLIHALTEKEHLLLMAWCIGVYAFLPSFAKANVVFNYVTWFSVLYVIASYIRLYPKKWFSNVTVTGLIAGVSLLLSWVSIIVLAMFSRMVGKGIGLCYFFVADSNKVFALMTGVSAFLFFKNLRIGYSRGINTIAAATFGVLCIHANSDTMRRWLWVDVCNNVGAYQGGNVIIHAVVSVAAIYTVCTIIDKPMEIAVEGDTFTPETQNNACVGIIGGADGPTVIMPGEKSQGRLHAACSALHFEPVRDDVEWCTMFSIKNFDETTINLI